MRARGRISRFGLSRTTGLAGLVGAYALLRFWVTSFGSPTVFPDSVDYARISRLSLFDPHFYGAIKPWVVPLLWKLLPGPAAVDHAQVAFTQLGPVVVAQTLLSAAAWLFLAFVVRSTLRTAPGRTLGFCAVLVFSLSSSITDWDSALLSESLSLSLTAVSVGCLLLLVRRPSRLTLGASLIAIFLWSFTRDTNAWHVVFAVPVIALALARSGRTRLAATLAAGTIAIAGGVATSFAAGHRGDLSTQNAIAVQMYTQPGAYGYFAAQGMPLRPELVWLLGERPVYLNWHDPRLAAFHRWFAAHGTRAYLTYLAARPDVSLGIPLRHLDRLYAPLSSELEVYRSPDTRRALPSAIDELAYPRSAGAVAAFALIALAGIGFLARRRSLDGVAVVPAALFLSTLPVALIVWNGDGVEFDRHLLGGAVIARVCLLVFSCLALDGLLAYARERRGLRSLPLGPLAVQVNEE